jgi:hypothetical protein
MARFYDTLIGALLLTEIWLSKDFQNNGLHAAKVCYNMHQKI